MVRRREINLAFYCYPKKGAVPDFQEVARRIEASTDDISAKVFVTSASMRTFVGSLALAARPTVTIEMDRIKFAGIPRGRRLRHRVMGKVAESEALVAAGIPTPRTVAIEPDTILDPAEWGPYVVVKPNIGRRGAFVWIHKTSRVRYKPPSEFPPGHYGRRGMIAQKFVYTGEWPVAYRVLTYFGRVILAIRYDGERNQPPLLGLTDFRSKGGYRIVAPAIGCTISTVNDPEILDLARRTHAALPEIPSLGVESSVMRTPTSSTYWRPTPMATAGHSPVVPAAAWKSSSASISMRNSMPSAKSLMPQSRRRDALRHSLTNTIEFG